MPDSLQADPSPQRVRPYRLLVGIAVLATAIVAARFFGLSFSFDQLVARETTWRAAIEQSPATSYTIAFFVYVIATALALPVALALSLTYGWLFGFGTGVVLVSFASTTGAACSFLVSRYLVGDVLQRHWGERLAALNRAVERDGARYLFTLRLLPFVPFVLVNVGMGLTRMRVVTFWWVSQLGMLPATAVYLFAASSVKSLAELQREGLGGILTPRLIMALVLLALLPWLLRFIVARWQPTSPRSPAKSSEAEQGPA